MSIGWQLVKTVSRLNGTWRANVKQYENFFKKDHYYSPIPRIEDVQRDEQRIFSRDMESLPGIDLNTAGQLALLSELASFQNDLPFPDKKSDSCRYYFDNKFFLAADAVVYYSLLRALNPSRIIEIGSGFSSAVALDTNELFFDGAIECTFIEPDTTRLDALLRNDDRSTAKIVPEPLQNVDLSLFSQLQDSDVLFVDSSHVGKVGSDVNCILFEILPSLAPGVVVHFHDIFYPFEYPKDWIYRGIAWNEAYMLRAFLQHNSAFEVLIWPDYLARQHTSAFEDSLPHATKGSGSLWIRRTNS